MPMKNRITKDKPLSIIVIVIALISCGGNMPVHEQISSEQLEHIQHYLETAEHLNEDQRQAIKHGKPFIGMTYKEARMAMTPVDWHGILNGKILKAQFNDRANRRYVLIFDYGAPNRVKLWSVFAYREVKELTNFRDVHPSPPIPSQR